MSWAAAMFLYLRSWVLVRRNEQSSNRARLGTLLRLTSSLPTCNRGGMCCASGGPARTRTAGAPRHGHPERDSWSLRGSPCRGTWCSETPGRPGFPLRSGPRSRSVWATSRAGRRCPTTSSPARTSERLNRSAGARVPPRDSCAATALLRPRLKPRPPRCGRCDERSYAHVARGHLALRRVLLYPARTGEVSDD